MTKIYDPATGSSRRWAIFFLGGLNFIMSMYYRASITVISPTLIKELGLSTYELSHLSAVFYYVFAACQIPLGISIDKFGPRKVLIALSIPSICGAMLFALGDGAKTLILGRAIIAIGMSGNMMLLMAFIASWFPGNRFASLTGAAISLGCVGSLLASSPLALMSQWIGWRGAFIVSALVNAVILLIFISVAQDSPNEKHSRARTKISAAKPLLNLAKSYNFWAISLSNFMRYGYFAALQSLWLGPFLFFGMGYSQVEAGNYLFYMGLAYMFGLPLWGAVSDTILKSRKWVVLPTMLVFGLAALSFTFWNDSYPVYLQIMACFALGLCSSSGQVLYAHIKELNPPEIAARALTSFNLFTMLGVGVMIHILGFVLGDTPNHFVGPERFHNLWFIGAIGLGVMSFIYSRVPDTGAGKIN